MSDNSHHAWFNQNLSAAHNKHLMELLVTDRGEAIPYPGYNTRRHLQSLLKNKLIFHNSLPRIVKNY